MSCIYSEITELFIEKLEAGVVPWRCPYMQQIGFPLNFQTGKHYTGVNILLLALTGKPSPYWLTYKQAQAMGGQVRKGEKGTRIIKYGVFVPKGTPKGEESANKRGFLKGFTVFNASQIDGIEFPSIESNQAFDVNSACEDLLTSYLSNGGPKFVEGENDSVAFYRPSEDLVSMPSRHSMASSAEWYGTAFHELIHSTGNERRLNRNLKGARNSKEYAKEELIAEIGAAFLCGEVGLVDAVIDNSASYLAHWISILRESDNKKLVVSAASQASKACEAVKGAESSNVEIAA